eukprot:1834548-Amphidinium_carterae.1
MAADNDEVQNKFDYPLREEYVEYTTRIEGDTEADVIRLRQIQDLEDDIQSIDDKEYWDNREREEQERPEQIFWERQQLEDHQTDMEHSYRLAEARDRQARRDERERGRFPGAMEDLQRMRQALKETIITGRRQRLQVQGAQRSEPKAPPPGLQTPQQMMTLQDMTLQELRAKVRAEEERAERHQGGAYLAPTIPNLQKYKDRIEELEDRAQQEEDRQNRLRAEEQRVRVLEEEQRLRVQEIKRLAAEQAQKEREAREAEDLERHAANTEVPAEQVQLEVPLIPAIGDNTEVQTIVSSTGRSSTSESTGASTRLERQERKASEDYWENIIDCMYDYFQDDKDSTDAVSLHEGVLHWMELEDIKELEVRARGDPEATREYERYLDENRKLEIILRQDYESSNRRLENIEEFQQALAEKNKEVLRDIIYQYASDIRERKLQTSMERRKDHSKEQEEGEAQTRATT